LPARDVHKEVSLAAEIQGKPDKRADITVKIGNQTFWIDITAGTPTSQRALQKGSDYKPGMAARILSEEKERDYRKSFLINTVRANLIPFAVEATGRLGRSAKKFIEKVCRLEGSLHVRDRNMKVERLYFLRRLNWAVHHYNALIFDSIERDFENCTIPTPATAPYVPPSTHISPGHTSPPLPAEETHDAPNAEDTRDATNTEDTHDTHNAEDTHDAPNADTYRNALPDFQPPEHQPQPARAVCFIRFCDQESIYSCNQCFGRFCRTHESSGDHHCDDFLGNVRFWKDNLGGHANGASMSQLDQDLPTQSSPQDLYHNTFSRVTPQIRPGRQGRGGNGGLLPRGGRW
jgi:hypothetical protein